MLLTKIELHLRRTRMPETRFGRDAIRDPNLVADLRGGRQLRPRTVQRIEAYLAADAPSAPESDCP